MTLRRALTVLAKIAALSTAAAVIGTAATGWWFNAVYAPRVAGVED